MFFRSVFLGISLLVRCQARELGAAHDLEENGLILTSGCRVAVAFDRVAEVFGGQGRTVAVFETVAQVERDLSCVLVVLPRLSGPGNSLLVGIEPGEAFVGETKNVDLVAE